LLLMAGRFDEARARADQALALEPNRVDALVLRANALAGLKDLDGALRDVEQAMALEPSAGVLANAATLRLARAEPAAAEDAFKRAVAAAPASAMPQVALAHFYWSSGRLPEAEAASRPRCGPSPPTAPR
jgi:Flp pilus assembly protein TadD